MEDGLSFDFEGGLEKTEPTQPTASRPTIHQSTDPNINNNNNNNNNNASSTSATTINSISGDPAKFSGGKSYRKTVCRHWLRGLCMKGEGCGFLHQYDKSRMPICRFFQLYGECREQDCLYKHTLEDIKECHMYKLGFCPNGPDCRYRHAKLPGPPPPVQEVLQKIQKLTSHSYGNSSQFFRNRKANNSRQLEKSQILQGGAMDFGARQPVPLPHQQQQEQVPQFQQ